MATIQKRGDSYRIRVSCGYTVAGKQIEKTMTWKPEQGKTAKQIEKEVAKLKVLFEEKCQGSAAGCNMKFEPYAQQWFKDYAENNLRPRTLALMHGLEQRTYEALGHLRIDKINPLQIQSFINDLTKKGVNQKTGGGLSTKMQKHYRTFISDVLSYAGEINLLTDNPARRVKIKKTEQPEKEIYTPEEIGQFLELIQSEPLSFQCFCLLAIYGGFRRAELLGFEWKDIDFENHVVTVNRASLYTKNLGVFTAEPKTKNSHRSLKIPEFVFPALQQYKEEQERRQLKVGDKWHNADRLFTTWDGSAQNPSSMPKALKRFCDKNELRYLGLHSFRHLFASSLIQQGLDPESISAAMGHAQVSTTLNIYAHQIEAYKARISSAIGAAIPFPTAKIA